MVVDTNDNPHVVVAVMPHHEVSQSRRTVPIPESPKLKLSEISLFTKHIDGMKSIIESNYEYGIIMEDDCIFEEMFLEYLIKYITNLPINFDIVYPGFFPFLKYYKQHSLLLGRPIFLILSLT